LGSNKKSIGVSFKHPRGQDILRRLARESDILVENYLPGTLAKYGLGYSQLRELNPGLIYTSITGYRARALGLGLGNGTDWNDRYGQTGPYSNRAGYDVMVEAEFGLMHITGESDRPPVKVGVAVTDLTAGLYASNSIMAALISRGRTGKGQHIDVALSDCQVATLANIASSVLISEEGDSGRYGTAHRESNSRDTYLYANGCSVNCAVRVLPFKRRRHFAWWGKRQTLWGVVSKDWRTAVGHRPKICY